MWEVDFLDEWGNLKRITVAAENVDQANGLMRESENYYPKETLGIQQKGEIIVGC